ncbi:MAG: hypothetical protein KatS3mg076_1008 [Candidatus Binatia bacterium]|nr:MAG: hypothetical protein KatS3mg076_1008 [Candidatus Binatia bacterium]
MKGRIAFVVWSSCVGLLPWRPCPCGAEESWPVAVAVEQAPAVQAPLELERDPFRPFVLDLRVSREPSRPKTPLQKYDIGQLKLAGIVLDPGGSYAVVEDSIGMGYIVTVGTPIGLRDGVVTKISAEGVTVEERTVDYFGREVVREVTMKLPVETEEGTAVARAGGEVRP